MQSNSQTMPALMQELHKLQFEYLDGEGIDFEPYATFLSFEDTQGWFKAWTGNPSAGGESYLIFGQDGTGSYAALCLVRESTDLLEQPIAFFGSEGELGIIAQNFSDYLWLLAGGHGPYEAASCPNDEKQADMKFLEFAKQHATTPQGKPSEITARATTEFPDFVGHILSLCR